jgi:hypothetical protein
VSRTVGADTLTDVELQSFADAIDAFRASPIAPGMLHSAPARDDAGRFCEVYFYSDSAGQHPLAVVRIDERGKPGKVEKL